MWQKTIPVVGVQNTERGHDTGVYGHMLIGALDHIHIQIFPEDEGVESKGAVIKTGFGVEGTDDVEVGRQV